MNMYKILKEEIAKAKAPITNRQVACVIVDDSGNIYSGCNQEISIDNIQHSETNAVKELPYSSHPDPHYSLDSPSHTHNCSSVGDHRGMYRV